MLLAFGSWPLADLVKSLKANSQRLVANSNFRSFLFFFHATESQAETCGKLQETIIVKRTVEDGC